jgi:CBS domain-containing protein
MTIATLLAGKGSHVSTIRSTEKVAKAIRQLYEERIGVLVVVDRWGRLAGMFSERDVIRALAEDGAAALDYEVHELMTPEVTTCAPEDRLDAVMAIMTAHRIRHLPVMQAGRLVGLVSIGDLVKHRLDEKEIEANVLLDISRAHA